METQNALLTTLVDKMDKVGSSKVSGSDTGGKKGKLGQLADSAKGLGELARTLPDLAKGLNDFGKVKRGSTKLITFISDLGSALSESDVSPKKINAVSNLFVSISQNLKKLAIGLFMFDKLTTDQGNNRLISFISKLLIEIVGKIKPKDVQLAADGILSMSQAIAKFGFTLAIASLAYAIVGPMAMVTVIPVIAGFAYVFYKVGEAGDAIKKGAQAVAWMALAIVGMGLAMMLTQQLAGGSWGSFVKGALIIVAAIAIFGFAFYLIGSMDNSIEDGARAMAWVGLAIISLAIGLAIWQLFNIDFTSILLTAAAVVLIGIAFGIIGIFDKFIEDGAFAIMWTGIAIAILALAIGAFKLLGIGWEDLALTGAAVLGTGLLFAGAGALGVFIALGALAIMTAGAAMIVLAIGITVLNSAYKPAMSGLFGPSATDKSKTNMTVLVDAIVDSFSINPINSALMLLGATALIFVSIAMITMSAGIWAMSFHADSPLWNNAKNTDGEKVTQLGRMLDAIVYAFSINPIDSVFMMLGAVGLIFASVAMLTISAGIWAMQMHADSPLWNDAKNTDGEKVTQLGRMLDAIVYSFSINPIDSVFMMLGSVALLLASVAMLTISAGIWAIGKHVDSNLWKTSEHDKDKTNMQLIFSSIVDSMALGFFDLAALYMSVPAWLMVGASLMMIGSGVADFVKLYQAGIDPKILADGLSTVLTGVITAILSTDADTDWDSVEDGLDAISGVGDAITGIAEGVQAFAELKFPAAYNSKGEVTKYLTLNDGVFKNVAANMKLMIGAVAGVLTEIGASQGETGWFSKTNGEKGADVIRGIGGDLSQIADFVEKAADLRMPKYVNGKVIEGQTRAITPKMLGPGGRVSRNIQAMIEAVSSAIMKVGNKEAESEGWFSSGDITRGKEAIMGIGKDLKDIGDFTVAMAEVKDMKTTKYKIKSMLMSIPEILQAVAPAFEEAQPSIKKVLHQLKMINEPLTDVLEFMGKAEKKKVGEKTGQQLGKSIASLFSEIAAVDGNVLTIENMMPVLDFVAKLAEVADPVEKLADSFQKLAKNMGLFVKAYKGMDKKSMDKHKLLIDSLVVFAKVDPNALKSVSNHGKALLDYINSGGPQEPPVATNRTATAPTGATQQTGTKKVLTPEEKKKKAAAAGGKMDTTIMEETLAAIKKHLFNIDQKLGGVIKVDDIGN